MHITLVVTDTKRKNLFFVTEDRVAYPLVEAVRLAQKGELPGVYAVQGKGGSFLRTKPPVPKDQELECLSISAPELFSFIQGTGHAKSTRALDRYLETYLSVLEGGPRITPIGNPKVLKEEIKKRLIPHGAHILSAATQFDINPYLLGAILIDEIARALPFEPVLDAISIHILGRNTSARVAQVKTDTANDLIKKNVYNPNPRDIRLPFERMTNTARAHLYTYIVQPKHSIFFAAAFIRFVIDFWSSHSDLSNRPEIIGTLYHQGYGEPKRSPQSNARGEQVANQLFPLAKSWLTEA